MDKRRPHRSVSSRLTSDAGLFVEFGNASPTQLQRLRRGEGPLMQQVEKAIERWRRELDLKASAGIVPVILLYRRKELAPKD
jgi:hypothetical protein